MNIFSDGFHTSYQYNLATAFPEHEWTFTGSWSENRPLPTNVTNNREYELESYDFFLSHSPSSYIRMGSLLDGLGVSRSRLIYISHWGRQPHQWRHVFDGVNFYDFLRDVSFSPIVCVSHYMRSQFEFYSDVIVEVVPHFIPEELFSVPVWNDAANGSYINVVNNFYAPERGVGADFWDGLPVNKVLYGGGNRPSDGGSLPTVEALKSAVHEAKAYLWTADAVATSFAPLEVMALGCPIIAPDNLDWRVEFEDGKEILLYQPGDQQSCLDQLRRFEREPALRRRLSEMGRQAVFDRFNKVLFRARWERVFEAALSAGSLPTTGSQLSFRRGTGTVQRSDGTIDLITEIKAARSAFVVHPSRDGGDTRQALRNEENSISPLSAIRGAVADLGANRPAFVVCNDFGATLQQVIDVSSETLCALPEEMCHLASSGVEVAMSFGAEIKGEHPKVTGISEITPQRVVWSDVRFVEEYASLNDSVAVVNLDGLEPVVVGDLLERRAQPTTLIINCQPHVSWSLGCHVELLLQNLVEHGYRISFQSVPGRVDLSEQIAAGDHLPKLHRYLLVASRT